MANRERNLTYKAVLVEILLRGIFEQTDDRSLSLLLHLNFQVICALDIGLIRDLIECRGTGQAVQIVQRHHFASHLKRMAVVVRIEENFFAFVKVCLNLFRERSTNISQLISFTLRYYFFP